MLVVISMFLLSATLDRVSLHTTAAAAVAAMPTLLIDSFDDDDDDISNSSNDNESAAAVGRNSDNVLADSLLASADVMTQRKRQSKDEESAEDAESDLLASQSASLYDLINGGT
jgi:hypothetical protein